MKDKLTEKEFINYDFNIDTIENAFYFEQPYAKWWWGPVVQPNSTLLMVAEGEGMFYIDGEEHHARKGDIVYMKKGAHYRGAGLECREGEIWKYYSIHFNTDKELKALKTAYNTTDFQFFKHQFHEIVTTYNKKRFAYIPRIKGMLYSLMCDIINDSNLESKTSREYNIIKNAIDYMNKNIYSYDLSIDIISEQSGISGKYFRTLFKKFYGISPLKHIIDVRLDRAKELLCFSNLTVAQIAEEIGYSSEIYFYRLFKQNFHITPNEFRKKMQS